MEALRVHLSAVGSYLASVAAAPTFEQLAAEQQRGTEMLLSKTALSPPETKDASEIIEANEGVKAKIRGMYRFYAQVLLAASCKLCWHVTYAICIGNAWDSGGLRREDPDLEIPSQPRRTPLLRFCIGAWMMMELIIGDVHGEVVFMPAEVEVVFPFPLLECTNTHEVYKGLAARERRSLGTGAASSWRGAELFAWAA